MQDYLQLFMQEPFDPKDIKWFYLTRINYVLNGRRIFQVKPGSISVNNYFPSDALGLINITFNTYYLSVFSEIENRKKSEIDLFGGFNNLGEDYERVLVWKYLANKNDLYVFMQMPKDGKSHLVAPPLPDSLSDTYIRKTYDVITTIYGKSPGIIIKINNEQDLVDLNKYIKYYLFRKIHKLEINFARGLALEDIQSLSDITNSFDFVVRRAPIFGSYNLLVYSNLRLVVLLRERLTQFANEMNIIFEELVNVNDEKNLLKYW